MNNRDEYVGKMKAQLDQWNADIATWEAKAQGAQAEAFDKASSHFRPK